MVDELLAERRAEADRETWSSCACARRSALLAHLRDEPGADVVAEAIASGRSSRRQSCRGIQPRRRSGGDPAKLAAELTKADYSMARSSSSRSRPLTHRRGRLRPLTRDAGSHSATERA